MRARRGVVVQGGTITDFVTGIFISNSTAIAVEENRFTRNREAVFLIASSGNVVKANVAWQNQLRGIMIRPNASGVTSTQNFVVETCSRAIRAASSSSLSQGISSRKT